MTDLEKKVLNRLANATFLPGSFDKRFIRNMAATWTERDLTVKGRDYLLKMLHRYKRQIPDYKQLISEITPQTWKNHA